VPNIFIYNSGIIAGAFTSQALHDQQRAHTRQWLLDTRSYITMDDRYIGTDNIGNNDKIRSTSIRERSIQPQYTIAVDVIPAAHHPKTQIFMRPTSDLSLRGPPWVYH
jgi:hypothetical protein